MFLFSDSHSQNIWDKSKKSSLIGPILGSCVNIFVFNFPVELLELKFWVGGLELSSNSRHF